MKTLVLTGSKIEIAEKLGRIDGTIREVIVVVEEPASTALPVPLTVEELFAEMEPHMVRVGGADYSREAIYTRMEGE